MNIRHIVVIGIYVCLCLKSTDGRHKRETGPCDPNPCQNGGTCTVDGTDYTCSCTSQFRGRDCDSKGKCDAGWHIYGDKCFKFSSSTKTWEAAKISCVKDYSGYLAEIYSEDENNFLEYTGKKISSLTSGVWFGLKWHNYYATYIWVTTGTVHTYRNWLEGSGKEFSNVFCYKFDQSNGFWDELDCSTSSNYICEKEASVDPCFPNPCQNEGTCIVNGADYTCNCQSGSKGKKCETSGYCQAGWSHYGRKCYKFSSNTKTWEAAKLACVADEGAYLVEIMSAAENSFLQTTGSAISTLTTSVWLGLQWHYTKDDFYWVTSGTLYPYRNWGNGPRSPDFHCYKLGLSHGYWDPYDCSTSSDYICEKAATDDPCTERPCKNGGTCTSQSGSYTCT
ncbi:secretory phospholipase A2 receptor-like isoform X2 [Ruditapes philippinarum]|uniref:secretory phospholipase A2 receptor-like isoform X2 n=1 Tax=Ruditapes philippinarum TaxID=129788 RepID=UPI00295A60CE|nr:secretory phospholipase A2 receptor-like isoform X2 [Ruditapes philippinarum]